MKSPSTMTRAELLKYTEGLRGMITSLQAAYRGERDKRKRLVEALKKINEKDVDSSK